MNILRYRFLLLILIFQFHFSHAQTTQISGIVNRYAAVSAIDTCSGQLSVSDTAGFRPGGHILLIQMQGAEISSANNFLYGIIQTMNYAGRYERAIIDSVAANTIFIQKRLLNNYGITGKVQAVTIPQYAAAVVTDTLRCQAWNGATGGVLAFDVAGTLTLNAPVVADGAGFRGGAAYTAASNNCNFIFPETAYFYPFGSFRGSYKGEGVAAPITGKEFGRGPQANGGGGGNDHNSGGGGGANISDGGNGGNNDEPNALGCDGYYPGVRGYGIFFTANRMFLGGGGGAGHSNNALSSAGGPGGGIIVVQASDINGATPVFSANGKKAGNANGDGAGGGGGGGTIWLKADAAPANIIVRADGGDGGNTLNNNQNRCFGPGGGGAGGRIFTNLFGISSPPGGKAGIVMNSSNGCNGSSNNATGGDAGLVEPLPAIPEGDADYLLPQILAGPISDTICEGDPAFFAVQANAGNWTFQWQQNNGAGWQNITGGNFSGVATDSLVLSSASAAQNGVQLRCLVQFANCFQATSFPATLTVVPTPTAGFTTSVNGYTANFSNLSSASSYYWNFGDGKFSPLASPQHTYTAEGTYTVTLYAIEVCDTAVATQTVVIALAPTAGFFVADTVIGCQSALIDFENTSSQNAVSFAWSFPGGNPGTSTVQDPSVAYSAPGTYTSQLIVSNNVGSDTTTQTFVVQILDFPAAAFSVTSFPGGVIRFTNLSLMATGYSWNFGDGSAPSNNPNPDHQYAQSGTYTVTLVANNPCGVSIIQQNIEVVVSGVGTGEVKGLGRIAVYPNPTHEKLTVDYTESASQPVEIQIFDTSGKSVFLQTGLSGTASEISMETLPAGAYRLAVRFKTGFLTRTIVKQ